MMCSIAIGFDVNPNPFCLIEFIGFCIIICLILIFYPKSSSYEMKVLKSVLKFLRKKEYNGLCICFFKNLVQEIRHNSVTLYYTVNKIFPLFNKDYIEEICERKMLLTPDFERAYWWDRNDFNTRIIIIKTMIEDLKISEKNAEK